MLISDRLRHPDLFSKVVSPERAADIIQDGMNVGVSGFTPAGYPKKVTQALAQACRQGRKCRIGLWSGASVGPEIEEELASAGVVARRSPYYAASNKTMRQGINEGDLLYRHASEPYGAANRLWFFGAG